MDLGGTEGDDGLRNFKRGLMGKEGFIALLGAEHQAGNESIHQMREMQACIEECLRCYQTCRGTAMGHCLEEGGKYVEPQHFRLMMACAEICRTSAHFMLIGTPHHKHTCRECAEICEECASDCERLGDMQECVDACRRCAESCRKMAA